MTPGSVLYVDQTHVGRHVTGIERVALEVFNDAALAPHTVRRVRAPNLPAMLATQQAAFLALGLHHRSARFMFPGFPPSPLSCLLGPRCLMYVHDVFPLTRPNEVGWKARRYTAPSFRWALRRLRHFFVNSRTTGEELRRLCRPDALVALLRPPVRDVFGVAGLPPRAPFDGTVRLLAIGTIEPRKNYPAAIALAAALNAQGQPATLDIVGRVGWGTHAWLAAPPPFVRLHGYLDDAALRDLIHRSDLFISTSHAEGLGLPQLEVQHAALPAIVPKAAVFDETLGKSALQVDVHDLGRAAHEVAALASDPGRMLSLHEAARSNILQWNRDADSDAARFRRFLDGSTVGYADGLGIVAELPQK